MCSISTFIDLNQGILFVYSPHCKDRLPIDPMLDSCYIEKEVINAHDDRLAAIFVLLIVLAC